MIFATFENILHLVAVIFDFIQLIHLRSLSSLDIINHQ